MNISPFSRTSLNLEPACLVFTSSILYETLQGSPVRRRSSLKEESEMTAATFIAKLRQFPENAVDYFSALQLSVVVSALPESGSSLCRQTLKL